MKKTDIECRVTTHVQPHQCDRILDILSFFNKLVPMDKKLYS